MPRSRLRAQSHCSLMLKLDTARNSKTNDDRSQSTARDRTSKHTHPSSTWRPQEAQRDRGMFGRYGISVPVTDPHACLVPQAHAQPTMSYRCQGLLTPPCPECGGWQLTNCAGQLLLKQQASQGRAVTATPQCLPRTHTHSGPDARFTAPAACVGSAHHLWWGSGGSLMPRGKESRYQHLGDSLGPTW